MIFCQIENGVVVNRAVVDDPDQWPHDDTWVQDDTAQIGWSYDGSVFTPPVLSPESRGDDTGNYRAMIRRRAKALGPSYASLQLLKSIGE